LKKWGAEQNNWHPKFRQQWRYQNSNRQQNETDEKFFDMRKGYINGVIPAYTQTLLTLLVTASNCASM
jgi:hypothetical protein